MQPNNSQENQNIAKVVIVIGVALILSGLGMLLVNEITPGGIFTSGNAPSTGTPVTPPPTGSTDQPPPPASTGTCPYVITKARVRELDRDPITNEFTCPLEEAGDPTGCRDWVEYSDSNISRLAFEITAFQCTSDLGCDDVATNAELTVTGAGYTGQKFIVTQNEPKHRLELKEAGTITVVATTPGTPPTSEGCTGEATYVVFGSADANCKDACGPNFDGAGGNRACGPGLACRVVRGLTSFGCEAGANHDLYGFTGYPAGAFRCVPESAPTIGVCGAGSANTSIVARTTYDAVNSNTCQLGSVTAPAPARPPVATLPRTSISEDNTRLIAGLTLLILGTVVFARYRRYNRK